MTHSTTPHAPSPNGRLSHTVCSEVRIAAAPARVWEVLTDFARYPEWNPFTPRVQTRLEAGAPVTLEVHMLRSRPLTQVEYIRRVEPQARLDWGMVMGHPRLLTALRVQSLQTLPDQAGTCYRTEDRLSGLLTPLVLALYGRAMQRGFDAMAAALKARAEA